MIFYSNNLKSKNLKAKSYKLNAGMTYVELIVVLSIFAVMSSIVIFNYGQFQAKVDIKNLASDIALKIVEAQQSTMSGKLNSGVSMIDWKPSYGVYFNLTVNPTNIDNTDGSIAYNKKFNYFVDKDNSKTYASLLEKLDTILITKDNFISKLEVVGTGTCPSITDLNILFVRPDSSAIITSTSNLSSCTISYAQITIKSPKASISPIIKIFPSGRIQVN